VVPEPVRIGVIGDFHPDAPNLPAIDSSLQHAASRLNLPLETKWVATPSISEPGAKRLLESFDGIWAAPGSPYKSFEGMLKAIEFARCRDWPFLATCGGFQYTLIECARNVLGIKDADSAENNSGSKNIVIHPVACAAANGRKGAPKLSGSIPEIRLRPGSYLHSFYMQDMVAEEFFCNYEVNPEYEWAAMEAGFPVVARGANGEIRAIESPTHRFFIATLFQPQLSSKPESPHPLIMGFVQAAADWGKKKLDDSVLE
jgi:CTP synthase (UTP-ammonia lyase)